MMQNIGSLLHFDKNWHTNMQHSHLILKSEKLL